MAEDFKDPRETDWHPRRAQGLTGHRAAETRLLQAHQSGKLHHAWLISGPEGIGKATLAYRFARFLLHVPASEKAKAHTSLHVPPEVPVFRQVAAAAHPDLFVLQRAVDQRNKRLKTEIAAEDARKAQDFFSRTAGAGGWRVSIIDPADELNAESANALLKVVEEPPARSIFLIVCHHPGRILRTIRSRCLHLPLDALSIDETLEVLRGLPPQAAGTGGEAEFRQAAELSRGSPGRALGMIGSQGTAAFAAFLKHSRLSTAVAAEIAGIFSGRETAEDYAIFCRLLLGWIGEEARARALNGAGSALAEAHADINSSLRQADALNLDRRQTVTDALLRLEEALKAS